MKKICFVATIPAVVHSFLRDHIGASAVKWSVTIISNPNGKELLLNMDATFIPLAVERKVSPWRDLVALIQMYLLFRRQHFDVVHSIMPKTGLLAMLAGWMAGVPWRLHTFTGQVWATRRGYKRSLLKLFDRLIVLFATHVLVDSPSQRSFLVAEGVLPQKKGLVIGKGSICGIDAHRFHPDTEVRASVRTELGIGEEETLILFLGRLNRDKGMLDLAAAFSDIASQVSGVVLLLVGAEEDVPFTRIQEICGEHRGNLRRVSFTPFPERYMAAADIFCLPSYREGFGQVIIEAAACGVPTVASSIYGITDAVSDGETGLLFPVGDVSALTRDLLKLIEDRELRRKMGETARAYVQALFPSQKISEEMIVLYSELLDRR